MRSVALAHGRDDATETDRRTITGAAQIVLGEEEIDPDRLAPCSPDALAATMLDEQGAAQAVRQGARPPRARVGVHRST
jgi:hypothetical protein